MNKKEEIKVALKNLRSTGYHSTLNEWAVLVTDFILSVDESTDKAKKESKK